MVAACTTKKVKDRNLGRAAATAICLIKELNSFELTAHRRMEEASQFRGSPSQICEKDLEAKEHMNTDWAWLMTVWCTPLRSPCCTSIQFPPAHAPENEKVERIYRSDSGVISVETAATDPFGFANRWRYELEKPGESLLVSQIYSVWDEEEFPSI